MAPLLVVQMARHWVDTLVAQSDRPMAALRALPMAVLLVDGSAHRWVAVRVVKKAEKKAVKKVLRWVAG